MANLRYIAYRFLRRWVPPGLTYALASRDKTTPETIGDDAWLYARILQEQDIPLTGAKVLEIGPGTYNPFSALLFKLGVRKVHLQEPFVRDLQPLKLKQRMQYFWDHGPEAIPNAPDLEEIIGDDGFKPEKVHLYAGMADKLPCPDSSQNLVLSSLVLQFVPNMSEVFDECRRVLREGGYMLHIIDLRDHYFRYPFEMLTFSRRVWEKYLTSLKGGRGYHNRLRILDYEELCRKVGFESIVLKPLGRDSEAYARVKPKLHPDFKAYSEKDMSVTMVALLARKPVSV